MFTAINSVVDADIVYDDDESSSDINRVNYLFKGPEQL